jgi:hypothetical protein
MIHRLILQLTRDIRRAGLESLAATSLISRWKTVRYAG